MKYKTEAMFWKQVGKNMAKHPGTRVGQWVFNLGDKLLPVSEMKSDIDPFYNDTNIGVFMDKVREQQWTS